MNIQTTQWLDHWLNKLNVSEAYVVYLKLSMLLITLIILCIVANFIVKKILLKTIELGIKKTKTKLDDTLLENKVFSTLSHIAPAVVIYFSAGIVFVDFPDTIVYVLRLVNAYITIIMIAVSIKLLNVIQHYSERIEFFKDKSLNSYFQLVKIGIYLIGIIIILSFLLNKSPLYFFSALGAMTVVLLLIFKDTILGLVASIQLAANNMVNKGDWVSMPKYEADGDVIEMNLTTIKIQNWDKTITTIPTYAFISGSFKNWRGMSESGGRRIKRSINIKINSIKFCTPELLKKLSKIQLIKQYIAETSKKINGYNTKNKVDKSTLINGKNLTNIGLFRIYIEAFVKSNPNIHQDMTCLIRQLAPTEKGLPIEIYTFSNRQEWAAYEQLISDMFDHLIAAISEFELEIFQSPTGTDFHNYKGGV
ncbi:Small-conductance mechanosensitive channel [hydrothermal vent metagenome]|uniref:Small-conductance mechanosensitive channel n=1 Tax=hydrothermal vent metagenome TaxID=652676 RepID=A0A3B0VFU0_9ZZZZ